MSEQFHFDFKDWQEAFEMFYRKRCGYDLIENGKKIGFRDGNPDIVLVVSTASYVSGYWIEGKEAVNDENTTVYRSVEGVRALEERIKSARSRTVNLSLGRVVL